MGVDVRPVRDGEDLDRFVWFPFELYRGDPVWVPPLVSREKVRLDPARNPFFKKAARELLLAWRGGEVVGRVAAIENHAHNEQHPDARTGFFGFYEAVDEPEVAAALIGACEKHFRARDFVLSTGPMNLSRVEETGFCVEGYDRRPPFLAGHNPPYYRTQIEALGYEKERDALAYEKLLYKPDGTPEVPPPGLVEAASRAAGRSDLVVRTVIQAQWEREMDHAHRIFVEAFRALEGNYPMTRAEFGRMAKQLRQVMDPRIMLFMERAGEVVGFALLFPEVNEILAHLDGRLFPVGWLKALWWKRRVQTVSFKLMGVLPEIRKEGLAAHMALQASLTAQRVGYRRMEMSLVLESNERMRAFIGLQEAQPYLRYRLYRRKIA